MGCDLASKHDVKAGIRAHHILGKQYCSAYIDRKTGLASATPLDLLITWPVELVVILHKFEACSEFSGNNST